MLRLLFPLLIISLFYVIVGIAPLSPIILYYRIVRMFVAIVVAIIISLSTLYIQTVTQNNLADVYLLGISGSSLLGAYISIFLFGINANPYIFSLIFSILTSLLVILLAERMGGSISYILVGIAIMTLTYGLSSLMSLLIVTKYGVSVLYLLFGSLEFVDFSSLLNLLPILIINVIYSITYFQKVMTLWYGERYSTGLINVRRARVISTLIAGVSTAVVTSIVGIVPLLGLVATNISYKYGWGKRLILNVSIISSTLILFCDLISRSLITPYGSIPLSATLGLIGGCFMVLILLKGGV